jgi:uncharacterized protein (DUF2235 family)
MKRLIVCCDGTWNRRDQVVDGVRAPTNVAKVAAAVLPRDAHGHEQRVHYEPGVGTRPRERYLGGGLGVGLSRNVRSCYRFLVEHFEPGDELFLFGFSRGAFTARSTVGLVRNCGIVRREERHRVDEAYRLYRARDDARRPSGAAAGRFRAAHSHPDTAVEFVGVWDTVGALGIPIPLLPGVITRRWTFHDTGLSRCVRHAHHALAIDEQRGPFKPTLWTQHPEAEDQVLEQCWFAGVHSDVGGGYADPALAEVTLVWMAERARACGLALADGLGAAADPLGPLHDSRTGFYQRLPAHQRVLVGTVGGAVAPSVDERCAGADPQYAPAGLSAWLEALQRA